MHGGDGTTIAVENQIPGRAARFARYNRSTRIGERSIARWRVCNPSSPGGNRARDDL